MVYWTVVRLTDLSATGPDDISTNDQVDELVRILDKVRANPDYEGDAPATLAG